jgi:hypothetical protein
MQFAFALLAVLCTLLLSHVAAARAEWIVDIEGGIVYEDNLTRATRVADRRSDVAFVPALTVGHYFQLTDAMSLQATADFKGSLYPEFENLSNLSSTITLGVRYKLGLGAFAPWLRVFATGGALDYGDDVRDGFLADLGIQAGKRLSERIDVQGGYTYESIDAHNGVFNGDSHTVSLRGNVGLTGAIQLTLGYAVRWGDLVIHRAPAPGAPPTPHARLVRTFDTPLVAARIDATTHLFSAGLGYALTPHAVLNVGYEYQISFGPLFDYPNNLVRASLGYSF